MSTIDEIDSKIAELERERAYFFTEGRKLASEFLWSWAMHVDKKIYKLRWARGMLASPTEPK
jgi:hypothetical protein